MRKKLFAVSVVFVMVIWGMLLAGSSSPALTSAAPEVKAEAAPASSVPNQEEAFCAEDLGGLEIFAEPLASKAGCCQNHCVRDRDCDRFCGAKGAGDCVPVNSCCNQCACLF